MLRLEADDLERGREGRKERRKEGGGGGRKEGRKEGGRVGGGGVHLAFEALSMPTAWEEDPPVGVPRSL